MKLQFLSLGGNRITDAGLVHPKEMTNLQELNLINTQVSNEGAEGLEEALPNLSEIHR